MGLRMPVMLGLGIALALKLAGCDLIESFAAPKADLWPRWQAHDEAATRSIDHKPWDEFLGANLSTGNDGINRLAYGKVSEAYRKLLKTYIGSLTAVPISQYSRGEQRSYWVNLYNSLTVDLILSHYPVESIMDIDNSPGFFSYGPWGKKLTRVEGQMLSLNDIEHRILRPIWGDPRLHYVLNCAALGCPNLPGRPLTAANAEQALDEGARAFVNHPRGARMQDGKVVVSKIYNWFSEDFGEDSEAILHHIRKYAAPALFGELKGSTKIGAYEYDWGLNSATRP